MSSRFQVFSCAITVLGLLMLAGPARAQLAETHEGDRTEHPGKTPAPLRLLLGTQATLHGADMITTVFALRHSDQAAEGNPILAPLSRHPAALVAFSAGVNTLQIYTIARLHRTHPKWAKAWAVGLLAVEAYTVMSNARAVSQMQRRADGAR